MVAHIAVTAIKIVENRENCRFRTKNDRHTAQNRRIIPVEGDMPMMNVLEAIQNRRSIRRFTDTPVPRDMIETVLEAAIENMILAAEGLGLGTLWICDVFENYDGFSAWIGNQKQLIAAVSLGYPDEHPDKRGRKGLDKVVTWM